MIKTQHCPNCEATEQKLHDFQQEVSDAVEKVIESCAVTSWGAAMLDPLIIPKPKPDPLVEAWIEATGNTVGMEPLNAALAARGLEIVPCK